MPYEITAIPTWIVSSGAFWRAGTSGAISRRQARRVEQDRERDADRDEPDRADRVAPLEEQVAAEHRERERDAELEHVAPRPAADDDRAQQHRGAEDDERRRRSGRRRARQRARRRRRCRARSRPPRVCARSRTSRSRRRRRPAGAATRAAARLGRPAAVGEHHGVADVRREAERDEDHADREEVRRERGAWSAPRRWPRPRRRASGPAVVRTATARGLTLRTRPQFVQVSISAEPPEAAHRADDRELVVAAVAAERAGRVDQPVAPAVGQADREDRLAAGSDLGDARALLEGHLRPRLADQVDQPSRAPDRSGTARRGRAG